MPKVSALTEATALTDADEFLVNDGGTSKRATVATLNNEFAYPKGITVADDNLASGRYHALTVGPWWDVSTSQAVSAGGYRLGLSYMRGGTPNQVYLNVNTAGSASDTAYYVAYNVDANGMPSTVANEWGPFTVDATGAELLTGQTETVVQGLYWVGLFAPTANGGSFSTTCGGQASTQGWARDTTLTRNSIVWNASGHSTPQSFSAEVAGTDYYGGTDRVALLFGKTV